VDGTREKGVLDELVRPGGVFGGQHALLQEVLHLHREVPQGVEIAQALEHAAQLAVAYQALASALDRP
jgi:hypothetical protein